MPVSLRLRLEGRRLLGVWLCLLRLWSAGKCGIPRVQDFGDQEGRSKFRERNRALQEELRQVFAPYYRFCPACGSACCREAAIPYSAVDVLLYGAPGPVALRGPGVGPRKPEKLISCFRSGYLRRKLKQYIPEAEGADRGMDRGGIAGRVSHCPALTDKGCSLPWGTRPAICVLCACPQFLQEMDWAGFGRYMWTNVKYLVHLTGSLRALGRPQS